jgi:hypothetical protein
LPVKLSEPVLVTTLPTVLLPPLAPVPDADEPPLPPTVVKLTLIAEAAVLVYGVPVVPSVELAAPPVPAVELAEPPPPPP